jgi:hypothetical protein
VLHIVGGTWGELVGAVLQAIGLAVMGLQLVGSPGARAVRILEEVPYVAPHTA